MFNFRFENKSLKMRSINTLILVLFCSIGYSQGTAIGKWKSYFPFNNVIDIVQNNSKAFGITRNALIIRDFLDGSIERLTEVNGLSDIGLSAVGYNVANKAIIIGYENGNVDLLIGNETINLFQIKESNIIGQKKINHIFCKGNLAYLSTGFGIVVFDISKREVKDTYIIGAGASQLAINQVTINNSLIYAATEDGLYIASESSAFLTDFNSWIKSTSVPNFNNEITAVSSINKSIIVSSENSNTSDSLFVLKAGNWERILGVQAKKNIALSTFNNTIMVSQFDTIYVLDTNLTITKTLFDYDVYWKPKCNMIQFDGRYFYIADRENAIVRMEDNSIANFSNPKFIYSTNVLDIEVEDGQLWGSTGSLSGGGWNKTFNNDGAFHYNIREDKWTIYNLSNQSRAYCFPNECMNDFVGMVVNPNEPSKGYVCSFSVKGMAVLFDNKVLSAYDSSNSSMKISSAHNDRFAVKDGAFDSDGNLWLVNSWVDRPLLLKTPSGNWESFSLGSSNANNIIASVTIDELNGYKWLVLKDNKIVVYNDNGTPSDDSDAQYTEIL